MNQTRDKAASVPAVAADPVGELLRAAEASIDHVGKKRAVELAAAVESVRRVEPLLRAAPAMLAALERLISADNCNYLAHSMRREGLFDAARAAVADVRPDLAKSLEA